MTEKLPRTYLTDLRKYDKSASGNYSQIPLPLEIEELGIEFGDHIYEKLDVPSGSPPYLRIELEDNGSRHRLKIREQDSGAPFCVTLAKEYTKPENETPFAGYKNGDTIAVELRDDSPPIRVYTPEDYRTRLTDFKDDPPSFDKLPIAIPWFTTYEVEDGYVDIASKTGFSGDRVKVVPIKGYQEKYAEAATGIATDPEEVSLNVTKEDFREVYKEHGTSVRPVQEITVYWNPDPGQPMTPSKGEEVYRVPNTFSCKLELPKKGSFVFEARDGDDIGKTWLTYVDSALRREGYEPDFGDWMAMFYEEAEDKDFFQVFVPTPDSGEELNWQPGWTSP